MYGRRIIEAIKFTLFYIAPYRNLIYERKSIERAMTELQHSIFCSTAIMQLFLVWADTSSGNKGVYRFMTDNRNGSASTAFFLLIIVLFFPNHSWILKKIGDIYF